jgi:hypothetical protein
MLNRSISRLEAAPSPTRMARARMRSASFSRPRGGSCCHGYPGCATYPAGTPPPRPPRSSKAAANLIVPTSNRRSAARRSVQGRHEGTAGLTGYCSFFSRIRAPLPESALR